MTDKNRHRMRQPRHEEQCPVCGYPIRASLQWHFQEFFCSGCDTYLRWESDGHCKGHWVKAGVYT